jgi:hypothetical protein
MTSVSPRSFLEYDPKFQKMEVGFNRQLTRPCLAITAHCVSGPTIFSYAADRPKRNIGTGHGIRSLPKTGALLLLARLPRRGPGRDAGSFPGGSASAVGGGSGLDRSGSKARSVWSVPRACPRP